MYWWSLYTVFWECTTCNLFTSLYRISFCMVVFSLINCCLVLYIKVKSNVVYSAIACFKWTNLVQHLGLLHCYLVHSPGFIVCAGNFDGNTNTFLCRGQAGKSGAHHSVSRAFIEGFKPGWDWDWLWNSEAIYLAGTGVVCCILS